jgi:hypothetical protein
MTENIEKFISVYVPASLTSNGTGAINKPYVWKIGSQCGEMIKKGIGVLMVVSGSIASCPRRDLSPAIRSAIGNTDFVVMFKSCLEKCYDIPVASMVFNRGDLEDPYTLANIKEAIYCGVFVHVNARDYSSGDEIEAMEKGVDNFQLFKAIVGKLKPDLAVVQWNFFPSKSFDIIRKGVDDLNSQAIKTIILNGNERSSISKSLNFII